MSIRILQERCQQLKKLDAAIDRAAVQLSTLDFTTGCENVNQTYSEIWSMVEVLEAQRKVCREAIILHSVVEFGDV